MVKTSLFKIEADGKGIMLQLSKVFYIPSVCTVVSPIRIRKQILCFTPLVHAEILQERSQTYMMDFLSFEDVLVFL